MIELPYHPQSCRTSCGPAALAMLMAYHGIEVSERELMERAGTSPRSGTDNEALVRVARAYGLPVQAVEPMAMETLAASVTAGEPVLINYRNLENGNGHFALVTEVLDSTVVLCDPEYGYRFRVSLDTFTERWVSHAGDHVQWGMVVKGTDSSPMNPL